MVLRFLGVTVEYKDVRKVRELRGANTQIKKLFLIILTIRIHNKALFFYYMG